MYSIERITDGHGTFIIEFSLYAVFGKYSHQYAYSSRYVYWFCQMFPPVRLFQPVHLLQILDLYRVYEIIYSIPLFLSQKDYTAEKSGYTFFTHFLGLLSRNKSQYLGWKW